MNTKQEKTNAELHKMINEAPNNCPITGLEKCDLYTIGDNVVYLPYPPYDAYTLPEYIEQDKAFYRTKYDMDNDFIATDEHLCDLEDLVDHPNLEEIIRFYKIQ